MILFEVWHLAVLACICLAIISVAAYANATLNFQKICRRNIILVFAILTLSFGLIPNNNLNTSFKLNTSFENTIKHTNEEDDQEGNLHIISKVANFLLGLANKVK